MKRFGLIAVALVVIAGLAAWIVVKAIAPKDYDECILKGMKGINERTAAGLIMISCENKFPDEPFSKLSSREKARLLKWNTDRTWTWHQESPPIQISYGRANTHIRRVYPEQNLEVVAGVYINSENKLNTIVHTVFHTSCEPDSEIVTKLTYDDGSGPYTLTCSADGDSLSTGFVIVGAGLDSRYTMDFGGFKVDEDFALWDFTLSAQHATLSKAKPKKTQ